MTTRGHGRKPLKHYMPSQHGMVKKEAKRLLRQRISISEVARQLHVSRGTVKRWQDPEYAAKANEVLKAWKKKTSRSCIPPAGDA